MRNIRIRNLSLWFQIFSAFGFLQHKPINISMTPIQYINKNSNNTMSSHECGINRKRLSSSAFFFWLLIIFATLEIFISDSTKESLKIVLAKYWRRSYYALFWSWSLFSFIRICSYATRCRFAVYIIRRVYLHILIRSQ